MLPSLPTLKFIVIFCSHRSVKTVLIEFLVAKSSGHFSVLINLTMGWNPFQLTKKVLLAFVSLGPKPKGLVKISGT